MRKVLSIVFTILIMLPAGQACAKSGLSIYAFTGIGINTSQVKKYYLEGRLFTNVSFDEGIPLEFGVFRRLKQTENYRFSLGLGVNFDLFRQYDNIGYFILPVVFQVMPFKTLKNLSLIADLSPAVLPGEEFFGLRQMWGFRYSF